MKRKLFILGAFALLLAGGSMWSCQKDDVMNSYEDDLMLKKAKSSLASVGDELNWEGTVCAGEAHQFCLTFPQDTKGNGDPKETNGQVQLLVEGDDPETEDAVETEYWIQIAHGGGNTGFCFDYTFESAGTYDLRFKASSSKWSQTQVEVVNCGCEESFTYETIFNEDGTEVEVTFTYIPEEDMDDATVVFTFAQSVVVTGLEDWTSNGVTKQKVMDLVACQEYSWTVTLGADCNGKGQSSANAWTDFKVDNKWEYDEELEEDVPVMDSKKGDLVNINVYCPDSE